MSKLFKPEPKHNQHQKAPPLFNFFKPYQDGDENLISEMHSVRLPFYPCINQDNVNDYKKSESIYY